MSRVTTEIRPAVVDDLAGIVSLSAARLPLFNRDLEFSKRYFHWKYFDLAGRNTGYPAGFVAEDAGGITGFLGCLPFTLCGNDWSTAAGWIADWSLAARVRGRGIGRALLAAARNTIPALACVEGSAEAQALFLAQGFQSWEGGRCWLWVARPVAYEWPRRAGCRRALGLARAAEHFGRSLVRAGRVASAHRLEVSDSGWDELGERLDLTSREWGGRRTQGYLQWLGRSPAADTRVHRVRSAGDDIGVALTHRDRDQLGRRRARILDLVVPEASEQLAGAYAALSRALILNDGVDYIDLIAPIRHDTALRSAGFEPRSRRRLWLTASNTVAPPVSAWRLTLVDKDDAFRGSWQVP